jgi:hypothetical protein
VIEIAKIAKIAIIAIIERQQLQTPVMIVAAIIFRGYRTAGSV